jgi:hypothetical protein
MKNARTKFEVRCGRDEWIKTKKAVALDSGWLEYETADGTIGLAQPKNFREVPAGQKATACRRSGD